MLPRICRCCGLVITRTSLGNSNLCSACASVGLESVSPDLCDVEVDLPVQAGPTRQLSEHFDSDPRLGFEATDPASVLDTQTVPKGLRTPPS